MERRDLADKTRDAARIFELPRMFANDSISIDIQCRRGSAYAHGFHNRKAGIIDNTRGRL